MATPVTHIVLANKVFDKFLSRFSKKDFLIGTSFPDIRYLAKIERNQTHYRELDLEDLKSDNSFMAGVKFHSILDEVREAFVVANDLYSMVPKSKFTTQSLKFLEDELLYDKFKEWEELIRDLEEIPYVEIQVLVEKPLIEKWYQLLKNYFAAKPNPASREELIRGIGFTKEEAAEMNKFVADCIDNKKIQELVLELYDKFDQLLLEKRFSD